MLKVLKVAVLGSALLVAPFLAADNPVKSHEAQGLEKVKVKRLDEVFVKPDVDWAIYTGVAIDPLDMTATKIKAPSSTKKRDIPVLDEKFEAPFKESYMKAFTREFSEDNLLVDAGAAKAGTLRISAKLLELAPTYIPSGQMNIGRSDVYTETAGKMQIQFDLYDAKTGEHLAKITDQREGTRMWRENNRVNNRSQVNQIMNAWARLLRTHLDDIAQK